MAASVGAVYRPSGQKPWSSGPTLEEGLLLSMRRVTPLLVLAERDLAHAEVAADESIAFGLRIGLDFEVVEERLIGDQSFACGIRRARSPGSDRAPFAVGTVSPSSTMTVAGHVASRRPTPHSRP